MHTLEKVTCRTISNHLISLKQVLSIFKCGEEEPQLVLLDIKNKWYCGISRSFNVCLFVSRVGWGYQGLLQAPPPSAWHTCPYLQRSPLHHWKRCFRNPNNGTIFNSLVISEFIVSIKQPLAFWGMISFISLYTGLLFALAMILNQKPLFVYLLLLQAYSIPQVHKNNGNRASFFAQLWPDKSVEKIRESFESNFLCQSKKKILIFRNLQRIFIAVHFLVW